LFINLPVSGKQVVLEGTSFCQGCLVPYHEKTLLLKTMKFAGGPHPWLLFTLTVILTNTIVESHTEGVVIHTGNTAILNGVLWFHNDGKTGDGANHIVIVTNAIDGDPAFVDPDGGDYHIGARKAARDRGVDAGVTDHRPGRQPPSGGCRVRSRCLRIPIEVALPPPADNYETVERRRQTW
jgi:hypothetical protein